MYNMFMPKRLSIHPHLSTDELARRSRAAQSPVARRHWQIVWLLAQGLPSARVAAVTGYTVNWVRTMAQRFKQDGPAGLGDRRPRNPGRVGLLSAAHRAALAAALRQPPADGGVDGAQSGGVDGHCVGSPCPGPAGVGDATAPGLDLQGAPAAPCEGGSSGPGRL
jgi:hypothetical protein